MKRRQFIKTSIAIGGTIASVSGGAYLLIDETNKFDLKISSALNKLELLSDKNLVQTGKWELYKIFTHCAQSVEYSMSKFPEHKSSFFKNTIGKLAFSLFSSKGKMTHSLSEPIPGSPLIDSTLDTTEALNHLKKSLTDFDNYKGELAPHFAYGELTKSDYEIAHVMHLYNHLQEVKSIQFTQTDA
ncbi:MULTISPECIES: DUF1569 domain-containing protein [Colwellia]|uniref:Twin-arginine translocation pathway signal n=1 Tax=Colwellia psychrerythraea (strain 34H / ATCC BAA-681) TaxID=167879 RepID=Q47YF7_COLP3|nr:MULTISPECIES: DUF1569 domain-containing protein [Colwellia]AAZ24512.1 hypothetical protein CPS_3489 [Colwellia psychrerythraea 34H]PKH86841.1 DUF1569 domain-containing protein [Colwellia sp. Bg11-28]